MTPIEAQLDRAFAPLAATIEAGRIPGGVLGIVDTNGNRATRAMGLAQTVPTSRPMTEDTWFDLASLTKVLFTTERILALADGRVVFDSADSEPLDSAALRRVYGRSLPPRIVAPAAAREPERDIQAPPSHMA